MDGVSHDIVSEDYLTQTLQNSIQIDGFSVKLSHEKTEITA